MDQLGALGIGIATLAIVLTVTFLIISQGEEQIIDIQNIDISDPTNTSTWTTAYNATMAMGDAVDDVPGWVPLIVITAIGSLLLGLVAMFKRR